MVEENPDGVLPLRLYDHQVGGRYVHIYIKEIETLLLRDIP